MGTLAAIGAMTGAGGGVSAPPAPVISAIAATVNGDGTTTVTWTTDIAATSVLRSGATTSYGTTASSASEVTSHSQTITADEGVYHYQVESVANGQTATSADKLTMVSGHQLGHFYIHPHVDATGVGAVNYFYPVANQDGSATGAVFVLASKTATLGAVLRVFNYAYEGAMYPGIMFDWTPDAQAGSPTSFTAAGNVAGSTYRLWNLGTNASGGEVKWNVPAWVTAANGFPDGKMDTLVVFMQNGSGTVDVWRDRGGALTKIASALSATSYIEKPQAVALTAGNELMAGDVVFYKSTGATAAKIASLQAYASTGTFPNDVAHRITPAQSPEKTSQWYQGIKSYTPTPVTWSASSTAEGAWAVGPTGQTPVFVGGGAHQGGGASPPYTYGQETSITETWTKNGSPFTLVGGYQRARIQVRHQSTTVYTDGTTALGEIDTYFIATRGGLRTKPKYTATTGIRKQAMYPCMLPLQTPLIDSVYGTLDGVTATTPSNYSAGAVGAFSGLTDQAAFWAYGGTALTAAFGMHAKVVQGSLNSSEQASVAQRYKTYFDLGTSAAANVSSGTVWEGLGDYFHCPTTGPVKPTLATAGVVIGGDGRTVLIKPTTATDAITGDTGITLKRGGSSLMTGATTTNNGDGSITVALSEANKVLSGDTITIDVAATSLYDAYGIAMAAVTAGATTNHSTQ